MRRMFQEQYQISTRINYKGTLVTGGVGNSTAGGTLASSGLYADAMVESLRRCRGDLTGLGFGLVGIFLKTLRELIEEVNRAAGRSSERTAILISLRGRF
jgi:hypothetical protein